MDLNNCRICRYYDPIKMYCHSYLRGVERICVCTMIRDVVPVVRCLGCKHRILNENYDKETPGSLKAICELDTGDPYELGRRAEDDSWFCADGELKDGVD